MEINWQKVALERDQEITGLQAEIVEFKNTIATLQLKISDLEERLNRNSTNSSIPPSFEGLSKPPVGNRAERRSKKRSPGKQPGSEGKHLAKVENPDEVVIHRPDKCHSCGEDLINGEVVDIETRQVFELPKMAPLVIEHQLLKVVCSCGSKTKALPPKEATAPTCYGPSIRSLVTYLSIYQHVPYDRLCEIFSDVLSIPISPGTVAKMISEGGGLLGLFTETITDLLRDAPVVQYDETGARVEGSLYWVHVASSCLYTLLTCHKRRGKVAMDEMAIISNMKGIAVHDGWKPYKSYEVIHQLCNAHHLRELQAVSDNLGQQWADEMIELLLFAKAEVEKRVGLGKSSLDKKTLKSIKTRYEALIEKGNKENPATDKSQLTKFEKKTISLLFRLDTYSEDVLRFIYNFNSPFTNNQAERDIRMVKLQQKISGSWRTKTGASNFLAIRSYISTMKKHDYNILDGLNQLFNGKAWLPRGPE